MKKDIETYDVELSDTINDSVENRKAYFVRPFGTEESNGPFRGRDLLRAIKSGGILQNDLIRRESSNNWHRVDEIAELQHLFQQAQTIRTQNHKTKSIPLKWIILAIVILTLVIESAFWVGGMTSDLAGDVLIAGLALIFLTLIIGNVGHGIRCVAQLGRIIKSSIKKNLTKSVTKVKNLGNKSKKPLSENKKTIWSYPVFRWCVYQTQLLVFGIMLRGGWFAVWPGSEMSYDTGTPKEHIAIIEGMRKNDWLANLQPYEFLVFNLGDIKIYIWILILTLPAVWVWRKPICEVIGFLNKKAEED